MIKIYEPIIGKRLHLQIEQIIKTNSNKMINRYFKSTKCFISVIFLSVLILAQGCGVTDSDDPNEFTVPFEIVVPVSQTTAGTYNITSGRFSAKFPDRENAVSYTIRVIREDGSKAEPSTRRKDQFSIVEGVVEYGVMVGTPTFVFDVNEATKDAYVQQFTEVLMERKHLYKELEVTVNF